MRTIAILLVLLVGCTSEVVVIGEGRDEPDAGPDAAEASAPEHEPLACVMAGCLAGATGSDCTAADPIEVAEVCPYLQPTQGQIPCICTYQDSPHGCGGRFAGYCAAR